MRKFVYIILVVLILTLIPGCQKTVDDTKHSCTVLAMDTVMTLTAYGEKGEAALQSAQSLIKSLDETLSVTNEASDVNTINSQSGEAVSVSEVTMELLKISLALGNRTQGALDVSLTPVIEAWGFIGGDYQIPSKSELSTLLENVDYSKVEYDENAMTVTLPEGMSLSFGSTAKGLTGDKLMEQLQSQGVTSAIISLGGNVQALGLRPDGSKWNVALQSPFAGDYLATLAVEDKAVITSGSYERYFEGEDGTLYFHILDPETGLPAWNGLSSVTIVSDSGVTADGLSTALFVMGLDKAVEFWRESDDFQAIFVTEDKQVYITPGIVQDFTLTDEYADLTVTVIE